MSLDSADSVHGVNDLSACGTGHVHNVSIPSMGQFSRFFIFFKLKAWYQSLISEAKFDIHLFHENFIRETSVF